MKTIYAGEDMQRRLRTRFECYYIITIFSGVRESLKTVGHIFFALQVPLPPPIMLHLGKYISNYKIPNYILINRNIKLCYCVVFSAFIIPLFWICCQNYRTDTSFPADS